MYYVFSRYEQPEASSQETQQKATVLDKTDDNERFSVVCAMDFGTSCSGYAFCFKEGSSYEAERIFMNKNWGENVGAQSYKTPTTVLTGPGDEFVAFGYEAEEK